MKYLSRLFWLVPWNSIALGIEFVLGIVLRVLGKFPWKAAYNLVSPVFRFFGKGLRILLWPFTHWICKPVWGRLRPRLVRMGVVSNEPVFPWRHLWLVGADFFKGRDKRAAYWHLAGILALMFANIYMNYRMNSMPGHLNDAILAGAKLNEMSGVYLQLVWFVGTICAAMPVGLYYGYLRTRMAIVMRVSIATDLIAMYIHRQNFMKLNGFPEIDNPDQRLTQDVDGFCNQVVGLFISLLDAFVTFCTFVSVLWFISGQLTWMVIVAAAFGSAMVFWIGRKLPTLSFMQSKREGDLRSILQTMRREADAVALYHGEEFAQRQALHGLGNVQETLMDVMNTWRNISAFNTVYNQLVPLIPTLIVATLFVHGEVHEFGKIAAAAGAFMAVYNALTVFVQQYGTISSLKAVLNRLGTLKEKMIELEGQQLPPGETITFKEGDTIKFENVTVRTGYLDKRVSIENLNFEITQNTVILGPNGSGKGHLVKAMAGFWPFGSGTLTKPANRDIMFLTRDPFLPTSTLRDVLTFASSGEQISDDRMREVLNMVELRDLVEKSEGFDKEQEWKSVLSLAAQERLALARIVLVKPKFAVIDGATSALEDEVKALLYTVLRTLGTRVVSTATNLDVVKYHDVVLELQGDGTWKLIPADQYNKPGWKRLLGL